MDELLAALRASVTRLNSLLEPLDDADLERSAYPSEWSIADVASHLGSGAVLMSRRLEDVLAGRELREDLAPSVWDTWNAKSPRAKVDDARAEDASLLARLEALTPDERNRFRFSMGPLEVDATMAVGLRLNEHTLHTWDVEVALAPDATLAPEATDLVIDNLGLIARFTATPTGDEGTTTVRTVDPERVFRISRTADTVTTATGDTADACDLTMPAEAFIRLVYGRLDPDHAAGVDGDPEALATLRAVYPGP
jgi:uncharacterized protein (TIGR03083 family)